MDSCVLGCGENILLQKTLARDSLQTKLRDRSVRSSGLLSLGASDPITLTELVGSKASGVGGFKRQWHYGYNHLMSLAISVSLRGDVQVQSILPKGRR